MKSESQVPKWERNGIVWCGNQQRSMPTNPMDDEDFEFSPPPWKRKFVSRTSVPSLARTEPNVKLAGEVLKEIKSPQLNNAAGSKPADDRCRPGDVVHKSRVMSVIWNVKSKVTKDVSEKSGRQAVIDDDDFQNSPKRRNDKVLAPTCE